MEQYGVVIENKGKTAAVNLQRHLICGECGKCGIMGASKRTITIEAHNPIQAEEGQRVLIESDDRQVIFLAFMLYIVPLAGLVAGIIFWLQVAAVFGFEGGQELQAVALGFTLMAVVFILIRRWDGRVKDDPQYKPVITGFLLDKPECDDDIPDQLTGHQEEK